MINEEEKNDNKEENNKIDNEGKNNEESNNMNSINEKENEIKEKKDNLNEEKNNNEENKEPKLKNEENLKEENKEKLEQKDEILEKNEEDKREEKNEEDKNEISQQKDNKENKLEKQEQKCDDNENEKNKEKEDNKNDNKTSDKIINKNEKNNHEDIKKEDKDLEPKEKDEKENKIKEEENQNKINEEIKEPENENKIIEKAEPEQKNENENNNEKENDEQNNENKIIEEDLKKVNIPESKNDEQYLANLEEEKELQNLIYEQTKNNYEDEDSDEDDEESFPFRLLGDVQKKGEVLGLFNNRYLEIDSEKGLLKRYASSKEYPNNPMETIPIKNLKTLKKIKKPPGQEFYEFRITYIPPNKTKEKLHIYRVRHSDCRAKWFESLLTLWKHFVKNDPLPPINKNKLIFIDDQVGINQEIKQSKKKKKVNDANSTVCLRNFKILDILGKGGFSTVFKVQHILTEKIYAMKVMNKNYIIQKKYLHYVVSEFEIMKMLSGFPFVLDIHYCFQTANYLYMIIDICPNGSFTDLKYINNLKLFLAEIILAFEHIHNHNVVYRDLKPENILLDTTGHIKVCDFNLSKANVTKMKKATSFCGSPLYLSPEMLDPSGVDQRADIYGIGLLTYEIVTGKPAFKAENLQQLYERIKTNKIDFNVPELKGDLKDLLKKILVADPDKRISIEEIKRHPYFKDISFLKVYKKEYGPIEIKKKDLSEIDENDPAKIFSKNIIPGKLGEETQTQTEQVEKEKKSEEEFKEQQKKMDEDKEYSFLDGKITVREMKKDQKRAMKNYVRDFYYVKKEDTEKTEEFTCTINGIIDIKGLEGL